MVWQSVRISGERLRSRLKRLWEEIFLWQELAVNACDVVNASAQLGSPYNSGYVNSTSDILIAESERKNFYEWEPRPLTSIYGAPELSRPIADKYSSSSAAKSRLTSKLRKQELWRRVRTVPRGLAKHLTEHRQWHWRLHSTSLSTASDTVRLCAQRSTALAIDWKLKRNSCFTTFLLFKESLNTIISRLWLHNWIVTHVDRQSTEATRHSLIWLIGQTVLSLEAI